MLPLPRTRIAQTLSLLLLASAFAASRLLAQSDAPPVDIGQLLQALRTMREQQAAQMKTQKQTAIQQVNAAASSADRAVAMWEDAVRAVQFDGMAKEGAQFRAWRDSEGEALKEREAANAARLYFAWLGLTLQRSSGVPVKDLLPAVINYTKELATDQAMIDALDAAMKKDKEQASSGNKRPNQRKSNDAEVKKMHGQILNRGLGGSVVVQWLKLGDWVGMKDWEQNPGNLDGIFQRIILPELRTQHDPRILEYWDMKLKKEADAASKSLLAFEIDKFNTERRPTLLWSRAAEVAGLGQKNRAIGDMFTILKTYPTHPDADQWIAKLEEMLMPPAPATIDPAAASAAPPR